MQENKWYILLCCHSKQVQVCTIMLINCIGAYCFRWKNFYNIAVNSENSIPSYTCGTLDSLTMKPWGWARGCMIWNTISKMEEYFSRRKSLDRGDCRRIVIATRLARGRPRPPAGTSPAYFCWSGSHRVTPAAHKLHADCWGFINTAVEISGIGSTFCC